MEVAFYIGDSRTEKDITVSIPAGYKHIELGSSGETTGYINSFTYMPYYDSVTHIYYGTAIPYEEIDSVGIKSVSCPNPVYGFKVLTGADQWDYYQPTDTKASIHFTSNGNEISFTDYTFNSVWASHYDITNSVYAFYFFNGYVALYSANSAFPLTSGQIINLPIMTFYWNNRNWGSQIDTQKMWTNGSTLQLKIEKVADTYFNASFSGKIWSSLQQDTLHIDNGRMDYIPLPQKQ